MARSVRFSSASDIIGLVDFMQLLAMNARSGRLAIRHGDLAQELVLVCGAIVAFDRPGMTGPPVVEIDEDEGHHRHRIVERFVDVMAWPDPDLEFTELSVDEIREYEREGAMAPLSVQGTLLEVHQTQDLLTRTGEIIPDLGVLLVAAPTRRDEYVGSPAEPLLERLDGRRTVREVVDSFGIEKYRALERLATLFKKRVVIPVDPLQVEMLAWEHESSGEHERALDIYRVLRRQDPGNVRILKNISGVLAHLGRTEEAAEVLSRYADASLADGLAEEGRRAYALAIQFDAENVALRERYVDALSQGASAKELVDAYLGLADLYVEIEDHILAKNALRRILKLQPAHLAARQRLAALCGRIGEEGAAVSELIQIAGLLRQQGDAAEALERCKEALDFDPGGVEARILLVHALIDLDRASEALEEIRALEEAMRAVGAMRDDELPGPVAELYERLLTIDADCLDAIVRVAEAASRDGRVERAVELESRLVSILSGGGRIPESIAVLERMIQRVPDAFELHARLADLHERSGETMRATAIYEFAGQGLLGAGRHGEAARVFGRLLEIDPNSADAAAGFARALRGRGETHRAVLRYCEAARILEENGLDDEAVSILEEALEGEPGEPECTRRAAAIHEQRGHRRQAIHLYLAALKVCRERGDEPMAAAFRRRILELEPDNSVALGDRAD